MNLKGFVFFDLDGTLLDENSQLPVENFLAIQQLKANGYLPIIASGRAPFEIKKLVKDTTINTYISLNGQVVVYEGKVIYEDYFNTKEIEQLVSIAKNNNHAIAFYTQDSNRINYINKSAKLLYAYDNAPIPSIDAQFFRHHPINFLYLFSQDNHLDLSYIEQFTNTLTFYRDSPYSLAVVKKQNSKRAGIELLLNKLNDNNLPSYAFGDGMNDLPMFACVDTSIAMANANDTVKSHATYVTDTNINSGITKALNYFKLI